MGTWLFGGGTQGVSATWLAVLLDALIKGTLVLVAAGVLSLCLRRSSAASRHLVWSLGLAALVLLPAFTLTLPAWQIPVLPSVTRAPAAVSDPGTRGTPMGAGFGASELSEVPEFGTTAAPTVPETAPPASEGTPVGSLSGTQPRFPWATLALAGWGVGALVVLARIAVGRVRVRRFAARALPLDRVPDHHGLPDRRQVDV